MTILGTQATRLYVFGLLLAVGLLSACQDRVTGLPRLIGRDVFRTLEPNCADPPGQSVNQVTGWCTSEVQWIQQQIDNVTSTPAGCGTMKQTLQAWLNSDQIRRMNRSIADFNAASEQPIFGEILADSSKDFSQRKSPLITPMRINIHSDFGGYQGVKETMRHEFAHVYENLNNSQVDDDRAEEYNAMCFTGSNTYPPANPTPAKIYNEDCTLEPASRIARRLSGALKPDEIVKDEQSCAAQTSDYPAGGPQWINVCIDRYYVEQLWVGQVLLWEEETYLYTICYHVELGWLME